MTEKPHYAIMRIGKIHTRAVLDAVEWHNTRQIPARTVEGMEAPEDWTGLAGRYRDRADKIFMDTGATEDEGKILAVEVLVTASPDWWATAADDLKTEWWKAQYAYAEHVFGPGLLAFTPHLDESTPHAQFVGLPLYHATPRKKGAKPKDPEKLRQRLEEEANAPKVWRLSHDAVFGGGPDGLAHRQTEYHGFVAHLGLSRGKDTVGLGIKNIPLKHYAKLLTQMDRELAREAAELAEERAVLEHYDQQLAEGYVDIEEHKQLIIKDELRLFADQEEFRIREEHLATDEAALDERREALRREVGEAQVAARQMNEREAHLSAKAAEQERTEFDLRAKRNTLDVEKIRHDHAKTGVRLREKCVGERERAASNHEAQNVKADADLTLKRRNIDQMLSQISVLTDVMAGRLTMAWDGKGQPKVTSGDLKPNQTKALETPWPVPLQAPLRHALAMASVRKKLADKLRAILSKLRTKRRQVAEKVDAAENDRRDANATRATAKQDSEHAEKRIREAVISQEVANETRKRAEEKIALAETAQRAANDRIAKAERIEGSLADKRAELSVVRSVVADQTRTLSLVKDKLETEQKTLVDTRRAGEALRSEQAGQTAKKEKLDKTVADLEARKDSMARDEARIDAKRVELAADQKKWANSVSVMQQVEKHGASVAVKHGRYVIILQTSDGTPGNIVAASDVHSSVFALVEQRQTLTKAMEETQLIADGIEEQRRLLAKRFPDQKPVLEEERRRDRKKLQKAWASIQADGQGR